MKYYLLQTEEGVCVYEDAKILTNEQLANCLITESLPTIEIIENKIPILKIDKNTKEISQHYIDIDKSERK